MMDLIFSLLAGWVERYKMRQFLRQMFGLFSDAGRCVVNFNPDGSAVAKPVEKGG